MMYRVLPLKFMLSCQSHSGAHIIVQCGYPGLDLSLGLEPSADYLIFHLLVSAAWDSLTAERINRMFDLTNEIHGFKNEDWENY
jgi:hypothetical protein